MKKLTIAFLYNIRHQYPDPHNVKMQLETDYDDPETIALIIKHLETCQFEVIPIEANEEAYLKLYQHRDKIDLAFNFSGGMYGKSREAHIPAILEMLRIPYTGSSSLTQNLVFSKVKTKEILLVNNIPTPTYQLFKSPEDQLKKSLKFPLIVKPVAQGSSAGITNKSVVHNEKELRQQVKFVIDNFEQEALVETFLNGREFSVSMLGNPPEILSIIEPDHSHLPAEYQPLDSLEVKWLFEEQNNSNHLICPANIEEGLEKKLKKLCYNTWNALEIMDWCRIDIRCDEKENLYVLEVNSPVGLLPPEISTTSYFPLAARKSGLDYQTLLKQLINISLQRYGAQYPNYN